jgi:hypothetical protein
LTITIARANRHTFGARALFLCANIVRRSARSTYMERQDDEKQGFFRLAQLMLIASRMT